jgi:hypothetical protein
MKVTLCGTRRGGENPGSGCAGSGGQSLRASETSTKPAREVSDGWPVKLVMPQEHSLNFHADPSMALLGRTVKVPAGWPDSPTRPELSDTTDIYALPENPRYNLAIRGFYAERLGCFAAR